jgi:two-component system aerobic respiration control sensor histidine kinase ArcB
MQVPSKYLSSLYEMFSALPESTYAKDKNGVYLACSQRMADMAGFNNPGEIIGKTDHDMCWRDQALILQANDRRVMETEQTIIIEERGHTMLRDTMLVRTIKSPLYDDNKNVVGIVGISFDITDLLYLKESWVDKLAADSALERAESIFLRQWYQEVSGQKMTAHLSLDQISNKLKIYMEGIIDKLPANIYWMDLDGYILGCNQQMATVLGYSDRNDIIGEHTLKFLQSPDCDQVLENNKRAVENHEVIVFEESAKFGDEEKIFLSHKSALCDENGTALSLVGVSFDITERKRMERELKIAKEEAEAANLAKMHFMNNMRHDLRTPLSCVVGSARILKALENDPDKAEFIEGILKSSQHLLQMLTNMLEFDHIQSKEKTIEFKSVNIIKLGEDLIEMLQLTAKGKNLQLHLEILAGTPSIIMSDVYRLQRVLMNLLNNAIKFTHEGFVKLQMEGQRGTLRLVIQDTGIGIEAQRKHEVFDKFVRLVDSDKGLYEGEGLGLAIVKQFVTELQGEICLDSEVGKGSTFTVILPLETEVDLQRM